MWGWKDGVLICCFIVAQPDRQDDPFTLFFDLAPYPVSWTSAFLMITYPVKSDGAPQAAAL
jgi:hypothetical protein